MFPSLLLDEVTVILFQWSLARDNADQGRQFTALIMSLLIILESRKFKVT
jgi:hypothetical protein